MSSQHRGICDIMCDVCLIGLREKGVNFTPSGSNSMSRYISLRDAVMRDSMEVDKMAETICYLDDTIHSKTLSPISPSTCNRLMLDYH